MENVNVNEKVKKKSGLATAALVLGIIGICISFIPLINNASFILGLLAGIFAIISLIKRASIGKAIAALILGILSIVITLAMQAAFVSAVDSAIDNIDSAFTELDSEMDLMTGDSTDKILEENLDVSIGSFQVTKGDFLDETKLTVTLKNKSTEKKSFDVEIEAVDSNGKRITTDYIYANDLNAGQSQDFDIFTLVSSDEIESLKNATFKIVEVSMY